MDRPANEQITAALAFGFLPLGYFMLLVATDLYRDGRLSTLVLPALLTVFEAMLCRALAIRTEWATLYVVGCFGACALTALVTSAFADFSLPGFV